MSIKTTYSTLTVQKQPWQQGNKWSVCYENHLQVQKLYEFISRDGVCWSLAESKNQTTLIPFSYMRDKYCQVSSVSFKSSRHIREF